MKPSDGSSSVATVWKFVCISASERVKETLLPTNMRESKTAKMDFVIFVRSTGAAAAASANSSKWLFVCRRKAGILSTDCCVCGGASEPPKKCLFGDCGAETADAAREPPEDPPLLVPAPLPGALLLIAAPPAAAVVTAADTPLPFKNELRQFLEYLARASVLATVRLKHRCRAGDH